MDAAVALFEVRGTPRAIEVMKGQEALLNVRARAHLLGGSQQDADFAAVHLPEQRDLVGVGLGLVDESDFRRWDAAPNEFAADVLVDAAGERGFGAIIFSGYRRRVVVFVVSGMRGSVVRDRKIEEHDLGFARVARVVPDVENILDGGVDLAGRVVGECGVDESHIESSDSAVMCDTQHVVDAGVDLAAADLFGALAKRRDELFESSARRDGEDFERAGADRGNGDLQVLREPDIRDVAELLQKFGEVDELDEAIVGAESAALRLQFDHAADLSVLLRPVVEVGEVESFEFVHAEVTHHGPQLRHRVGDRRRGGEHDTAIVVALGQILSLEEHVERAIAGAVGQAGDPAHLGCELQVLVHVGFVDKDEVDAQFLEANGVVALHRQAVFELLLQTPERCFELFDGEVLAAGFSPDVGKGELEPVKFLADGRSFLLDEGLVSRVGDGQVFKALVRQDDGVVVAAGDEGCGDLASALSKSLFAGNQDVGCRVQGQEFVAPLADEVIGNHIKRLADKAHALHFHAGG